MFAFGIASPCMELSKETLELLLPILQLKKRANEEGTGAATRDCSVQDMLKKKKKSDIRAEILFGE